MTEIWVYNEIMVEKCLHKAFILILYLELGNLRTELEMIKIHSVHARSEEMWVKVRGKR